MGFLDLFGKDKVVGTKVLVATLDGKFTELAQRDAEIYKYYYPATTLAALTSFDELTQMITDGYDVIHLFAEVSPEGLVAGTTRTGADLVERCCAWNVKVLWIASNNPGQNYINGFRIKGKRINLVMTIDRGANRFAAFLEKLLAKMSKGLTMPVSWVQICPQIPGELHPDAPQTIFMAGRGAVRLR